MQEVTDPQILAELNQTQSDQTGSSMKEVTDPAVLQQLGQPETSGSLVNSIADPLNSAAAGTRAGILNAVGQTGSLVGNIAKGVLPSAITPAINRVEDIASKAYGSLKQRIAETEDAQNIAKHPVAYGVGGAVGDIGTQTGIMGAALNPLSGPLRTASQAILPKVLQGPVTSNVLEQSALAAGIGSASNPEHPVEGALAALPYGAASGLVGGLAGAKLKRSGDVVDFETNNILDSGGDPYSIEGKTRIKKALKDNGTDYSKNLVQQQITQTVKNKINQINPINMVDDVPSKVIANLAQKNFGIVRGELDAKIQPIRENQTQFQATQFENQKASLKSLALKSLPEDPLPPNSTLDQMWNYREQLDDAVRVLKAQASKDTLARNALIPLYKTRAALSDDMMNAAEQAGVKDQFVAANDQYKNEYLPFKSFQTKSGKLVSPEDVNDAMFKLNKTFQGRNVNINLLNEVSKTLGPDGHELIGKAMMQNMLNKSVNSKGALMPNQYFTQLKKYNNSGLSKEVWGPEAQDAAKGIGKILDGADEAIRLGSPLEASSQMSILGVKLPQLLASSPGIALLRTIGSSKFGQSATRKIVQNLLTGTLAETNNGGTE